MPAVLTPTHGRLQSKKTIKKPFSEIPSGDPRTGGDFIKRFYFVTHHSNEPDYITTLGSWGNGVAYPDKPLDAHNQGQASCPHAFGQGQRLHLRRGLLRRRVGRVTRFAFCASLGHFVAFGNLRNIHGRIGAYEGMCSLVGLSFVHLQRISSTRHKRPSQRKSSIISVIGHLSREVLD